MTLELLLRLLACLPASAKGEAFAVHLYFVSFVSFVSFGAPGQAWPFLQPERRLSW